MDDKDIDFDDILESLQDFATNKGQLLTELPDPQFHSLWRWASKLNKACTTEGNRREHEEAQELAEAQQSHE